MSARRNPSGATEPDPIKRGKTPRGAGFVGFLFDGFWVLDFFCMSSQEKNNVT